MRRYPDGAAGKAFFQKDAPSHMPEWIRRYRAAVSTRSGGGTKQVEFPLVNDEPALLWMANMGCIDMNAWYSRIDRPDRPDFVLFDLDLRGHCDSPLLIAPLTSSYHSTGTITAAGLS